MELEFSRHIFDKLLSIKFHEIFQVGAELFYDGRTDRHDESFRNFANVPKKQFQFLKATLYSCSLITLKLTTKIQHSWIQRYIHAQRVSIIKLITKCDIIKLSWATLGLHHKS